MQHDARGERRAGDDLGLGLDDAPVTVGDVGRQAGTPQRRVQAGEIGGLDDRAGLGEQLGAGALRLDPTAADDHHPVGDGLDLGQQMRGEQHGAAAVGEAAQQPAHPAHALRIETVGGLVENQDLGVAEQGVGEAEALAHAERVLADALAGRRLVEADEREQRVYALDRHAHRPRGDGERLAAAAPGVLRRGVEQQADSPSGIRQVAVAPAEDPRFAAVRLRQADEHAHRGGLARPVGAEEAGDGARLAAEADVRDDRPAAELLGECLGFDHGGRLAAGASADHGLRAVRDGPCGGDGQRLW